MLESDREEHGVCSVQRKRGGVKDGSPEGKPDLRSVREICEFAFAL